jgi:hypothetical protein
MSFLFKNFKEKFYSKFDDYKIFGGLEFNYFKVALEGVKVNYYQKGKFSKSIFYREIIYRFFFLINWLKKLLNGNIKKFYSHLTIAKKHFKPDYLILDPGRFVKNYNGEPVPIYFLNLFNYLKKGNSVFFVSENQIDGYHDFNDVYSDLSSLGNSIKHHYSQNLRKELKEVFSKIKWNSTFNKSDLENIKCGFQKFYNEAIFWLKILDALQPRQIYMICHYHREGLIYAAKKLNIKIIEFQHGLIAKSDIFYNFPGGVSVIDKDCLFPDEFRVYGNYWIDILKRGNFLNQEKIKLVDYYLYHRTKLNINEANHLHSFVNNKKIILVTTQTFLSRDFIKYIDKLIRVLNEDFCLIIKPHPKENINDYNKYYNIKNVLVTELSSEVLLSKTDIHITMYSTTAFDALRHGLATYYIYNENQIDYINEIYNIIGGEIIYDYNIKPWLIENKLTVSSDEFFYQK